MELTRVAIYDGWCAKREDEAAATGPSYPSGSKVRQYAAMAAVLPGAPMIVGCSAHSAMQVYVAAAAKAAGVPGYVHVPARAQRTEATEYAIAMGAIVIEERPAYLNVIQSRAREHAKTLGIYVRWDVGRAVADAMAQCRNLPMDLRRVVVPTGSGLTAAGVLAGLAEYGMGAEVLVVAVSGMAQEEDIKAHAGKLTKLPLPRLTLVREGSKYERWHAAVLPDGSVLDPYYAAKAVGYVKAGDCLWVPGCRPLAAMPEACRKEVEELQNGR